MNARNLTRDVLGSLEVQTHGTLQTDCPKSSRPSQKQTQEEGEMHIIWEVKGQTHTVMPAASDKQRGCNYALSQQSSHIEPDAISKSRTHTYVEIRRRLLRITALCGSVHRKAEILLIVRD